MRHHILNDLVADGVKASRCWLDGTRRLRAAGNASDARGVARTAHGNRAFPSAKHKVTGVGTAVSEDAIVDKMPSKAIAGMLLEKCACFSRRRGRAPSSGISCAMPVYPVSGSRKISPQPNPRGIAVERQAHRACNWRYPCDGCKCIPAAETRQRQIRLPRCTRTSTNLLPSRSNPTGDSRRQRKQDAFARQRNQDSAGPAQRTRTLIRRH